MLEEIVGRERSKTIAPRLEGHGPFQPYNTSGWKLGRSKTLGCLRPASLRVAPRLEGLGPFQPYNTSGWKGMARSSPTMKGRRFIRVML